MILGQVVDFDRPDRLGRAEGIRPQNVLAVEKATVDVLGDRVRVRRTLTQRGDHPLPGELERLGVVAWLQEHFLEESHGGSEIAGQCRACDDEGLRAGEDADGRSEKVNRFFQLGRGPAGRPLGHRLGQEIGHTGAVGNLEQVPAPHSELEPDQRRLRVLHAEDRQPIAERVTPYRRCRGDEGGAVRRLHRSIDRRRRPLRPPDDRRRLRLRSENDRLFDHFGPPRGLEREVGLPAGNEAGGHERPVSQVGLVDSHDVIAGHGELPCDVLRPVARRAGERIVPGEVEGLVERALQPAVEACFRSGPDPLQFVC